ncbi:MAG: hypothetical protein Q7S08_01060 [bacterium]|nr:hypothetical protein [bacterium]
MTMKRMTLASTVPRAQMPQTPTQNAMFTGVKDNPGVGCATASDDSAKFGTNSA